MEKDKAVGFCKWLFDNKLVPNSSFLWFCYEKSREDVRFMRLDELYDVFEQGGSWEEFVSKKQKSLMEELNKFIK